MEEETGKLVDPTILEQILKNCPADLGASISDRRIEEELKNSNSADAANRGCDQKNPSTLPSMQIVTNFNQIRAPPSKD